MANRKLKIGIVVGEVSGDTLGVKLMRSFREQGIDAEFEGIGGPQMIAEGFNSYYPMETLSVMGIVEVLKDLKKLFAVRDGLINQWTQHPVDIFIGIDAPDFNLRLSKSIKEKNLPIKTVQYVSPSVWAWRQGRVHGIKQSIDLVLCLFPFEKVFYEQYEVPAAFVGHPLAKQLPLENPIQIAKQELGVDENQKHIALLPGSRKGEVERLLPMLLGAANILHTKYPDIQFLIPAINDARKQQIEQGVEQLAPQLKAKIHILENTDSESKIGRMVMNASDIIALASGTATLEAMLMHRPMVTFYKLHWLTYLIAKFLVKIPYYSLPNIIAGKKVIEELIQADATPENLAAEIEKLMNVEIAQIQVMQHLTMHKQLISGNTEDPVQAILQCLNS
ncbi:MULTISPECIES: lipid-A-disaccharide synthase [Acinetobacter calcoaceticus/baumannii complex]|uniref:Lipid-A-disaccharide synthase n=3 Tax=Acinetobacter baumannii TaxID=470 RepID=A0A368MU07_ACIBA|nr:MULTISPECIES: lipid-A-disaccharide synthase [Acinetobacter calcoaceticus/baumannii complex]AVI33891.1 lipid-A-disaccharide synthase [Acinetobacter baumannii]AYY52814.1 lipid-A-disaccharide synthase [Acinetobacter baumannii]EHU1236232.1 lipid-A-disaccharide synthase [Acinetobacter baumannii]EHU1439588.1 lipid-A-disaccharide synthase [Acinetobacter baumannii]EHU1447892.1 lipid-A-disaccharide synthase [Acinetobacter baumannii]